MTIMANKETRTRTRIKETKTKEIRTREIKTKETTKGLQRIKDLFRATRDLPETKDPRLALPIVTFKLT